MAARASGGLRGYHARIFPTQIGIISIGSTMRLPATIPRLARWYMLSGELINAQEAYRLGLVMK